MRIIVLVKIVPDVSSLKFDPEKKTLTREGVRLVVNSFDRRATAAALRIREKVGGTVCALSMGPPAAEELLKESLAAGVDSAVLLTDMAFAGSDTLATARALALAARKIGFDLIVGGSHSVDAETGQLVQELAEMLNGSLVADVAREEYLGDGRFRVEREYEHGSEVLEVGTPAVISFTERIGLATPITPEMREKVKDVPIAKWSAKDLSDDLTQFGTAGSPTLVRSIFDASYARNPIVLDGSTGLDGVVNDAFGRVLRLLAEKRSAEASLEKSPVVANAPKGASWSVFLDGDAEKRTATEVLGELRRLGLDTTAVTLGTEGGLDASAAARAGAKHLVHIDARSSGWSSAACAEALAKAIQQEKPYAVLFPSTVKGREVAARTAARLGLGLTGDATELVVEAGGLVQVKPAFGGNIMAEVISKTSPQAATIRPGVFRPIQEGGAEGVAEQKTLYFETTSREDVKFLSRNPSVDPGFGDIERAKLVIGAGWGLGSKEAFDGIREYATRLGAAVVTTRKVADLGWVPGQLQVGLTGKSIEPELYVAMAISGPPNHTIGSRKAKVILAVNKDPNALIFKACDVGIVADYKDVMPLLEPKLRSLAESMNASA